MDMRRYEPEIAFVPAIDFHSAGVNVTCMWESVTYGNWKKNKAYYDVIRKNSSDVRWIDKQTCVGYEIHTYNIPFVIIFT